MRGYREYVNWEPTREAVMVAMAEMRKLGYVAKAKAGCCGGCIGYDLGERVLKLWERQKPLPMGCVFWSNQDESSLRESGEMCIAFGSISAYDSVPKVNEVVPEMSGLLGYDSVKVAKTPVPTVYVGRLLARKLRDVGVRVDWDGDPGQRLAVMVEETPRERREERMAVRARSEAEAEEALLERVA